MLFRRLIHAFDNYGLPGVIRVLTARPQPEPPFRELTTPHPFDQRHGAETSGHIPGEQLAGGTPSDLYNTAYWAISPSTLQDALERLPEPTEDFTFIDLGCGKGRALLVAAQFPFTQILGVELSHDLCTIARMNNVADPRVAIYRQDAATAVYPEAPLVIFLYHPFLKRVLRRVLSNLERQRRRSPHPTYLLYANGRYEQVMACFPFLQVVWDYSLSLSAEDADADRHRITHERFTLYRAVP